MSKVKSILSTILIFISLSLPLFVKEIILILLLGSLIYYFFKNKNPIANHLKFIVNQLFSKFVQIFTPGILAILYLIFGG